MSGMPLRERKRQLPLASIFANADGGTEAKYVWSCFVSGMLLQRNKISCHGPRVREPVLDLFPGQRTCWASRPPQIAMTTVQLGC
jgi:hypothetical protein